MDEPRTRENQPITQPAVSLLDKIPAELKNIVDRYYWAEYLSNQPEYIAGMNITEKNAVIKICYQDVEKLSKEWKKASPETIGEMDDQTLENLHAIVISNKNLLPLIYGIPAFKGITDLIVMSLKMAVEHPDSNRREMCRNFIDEIKTHLAGIQIANVDLSRVNLKHANLAFATFDNCNLTEAHFSHANLANACLKGRGTNISKAQFKNANLANADLTEVIAILTHFKNANLTGTNLTAAVIRGTIFTGACMEQAILTMAIAHDSTKFTLKQLACTKSLIGARLVEITKDQKQAIIHSQHPSLVSDKYLGIKDIKPLKGIAIHQYKEVIHKITNIDTLIQLFCMAQSDHMLRVKRGSYKKDTFQVAEPGGTRSCQNVMRAVIERLVEIIKEIPTAIDHITEQNLLQIYSQVKFGHRESFFGKPANLDLPSVIKENKLKPALPVSDKTQSIEVDQKPSDELEEMAGPSTR